MMCRIVLSALRVLVSAPLYAVTYALEPDYTQVVIRWNHLGFSSPAAQLAQGEGVLEFDPTDPMKSSVQVAIPLSSLHTGVPALDDDLRSADFFATARFPTATFKSTKVQTGATQNRLKVTGDLSLYGETKSITLDVTIVKVGTNPRTGLPTVGFDATATLKRSDYELGKYVPQVGDEIDLHITSQGVDAAAYAEYLQAKAAKEEEMTSGSQTMHGRPGP